MSPRPVVRLETLGFTKVYDYVGRKKDWLDTALPTEGRLAEVETARVVVRGDNIAWHLGERLADITDRVCVAGKDASVDMPLRIGHP